MALLALVALCAVVAGLVWYLLGNEAFMKRQMHAMVMRKTGRSLDFEGMLQVKPGSTIMLEARDVAFSNADWSAEPEMARAGHLRASVDLKSLFGGHPVIHELELADCRLVLIENNQGGKNWDLVPGSASRDSPSDATNVDRAGFQLDHLQINHCELSHQAPRRNRPLNMDIERIALDRLESGNYQAQASGQISGIPLTLSGQFGPLRSFWQGGAFEHEIELHAGNIHLQSSGSAADILTGSGMNVSMQFSGPEFAVVTDFLALPPISSGAFDFSLGLNLEDGISLVKVTGDLGSLDVMASGELDRLLRPTTGGMDVQVTGPDLDALGQLFGIHGLLREAFTFKALARFEDGRMSLAPAVLNTSLDHIELSGELGPLPDLTDASFETDVRSDDIGRWSGLWGRPARSEGSFSASGHVQSDADGSLSGDIEARYLTSHLKASGILGKLPMPKHPAIKFEFSSANIAELAGLLAVTDLPVAPIQAKGQFSLDETGADFKNVDLVLADNRAKVDGRLNREAQFAGSKFHVQADIPSTSSLGLLFGHGDLPDQPLEVDATIEPEGKGLKFRVNDGNLGDIKLSLKGGIADLNDPSSVTADAAIELPSARLLKFLLPDAKLPDLPLSVSGGVRHRAGKARLQQVRLTLGHTTVNLDGEVNFMPGWEGSRIDISGEGADLTELVKASKPVSLPKDFSFSGRWSKVDGLDNLERVEVRLAKMKAMLNGTLDNLFAPADMSLQVGFEAPDASVLNAPSGRYFAAVPLSAQSRVEGSLKKIIFRDLSVQNGNSHLTGELAFTPGEISHLSGVLHADFLDLNTWLDSRKNNDTSAETAAAKNTSGSAKMVFTDDPVISVGKHAFDLDIDVSIDRADLGNTVLEDINLGILMLDDKLRLDPLQIHDRKGAGIVGKLALDGTGSLPQLDIELHAKNLRLGLLVAEGQDPETYPPSDVDIDLHGAGRTWREMASSLDGTFRLFSGKGLLAARGFQRLFSDFGTTLFSALSPSANKGQYTKLDCTVIAADVIAGKVKVDPIIMQTNQVTMISSGSIDLHTERIDLAFNSKVRKGLGISAGALINPFIKVGGTLASPSIELDAANAAISGGAAAATAGISVLAKSFSDRFLSSKDPCGDAIKKLAEQDRETR